MKTFNITHYKKWIESDLGFIQAENHSDAIRMLNPNVIRIFNTRFREIEQTGEYYLVYDCYSKRKVCFVFEIL